DFRVTDSKGGFTTATISLTVNPLQDPPTQVNLTPSSIAENSAIGSTVGTLSTVDPDLGDTFTYTFATGSGDIDNSLFTISGNQLQLGFVPDFETQSSYTIRVRSTDSGNAFVERVFTINISDVNEAPTSLSLSASTFAENLPIGTSVGTFASTDPDAGASFTYSLVPGIGSTDNGAFSIDGNQLKLATVPNFESQGSYSIRVRTTDQGNLTYEQQFTLSVLDVNEAPVISNGNLSLDVSELNEGDAASLTGSFSDEDSGDAHTVTIDWGDGSPTTSVILAAGVTSFHISHVFADDQPTATLVDVATIDVTIDDGHLADSANTSITVHNVAPALVNQVVTTSITEGSEATLTAIINDPSTLDSYTLVVDWGEGTPQSYNIAAGATSFSVSHQYLDDNPSNTAADTYNVSIVSFVDDDGGAAGLVKGGNIFLTGHDILSHSTGSNGFQNGLNVVVLDYLRGAGTPNAIPRSAYDVGVVNVFSSPLPDPRTPGGFGSRSTFLITPSTTPAQFANFLSNIDVLAIPEHETSSEVNLFNNFAPQIEDFFNAGGDLFVDSSNGLPNYYNFLPSVIGADGPGINQNTGFTATPAGVAIGINSSMINGFPTHNTFSNPNPIFTVFETHPAGIVSIGAQNVVISGSSLGSGLSVTVRNDVPDFEAGNDETLPAMTVAFD
ncbi:MAG: cadherin repeat domain-containing protein, partial [Planctomycetales bacterium]|nr:cadherin repeat domain-containing protein [Planctomycetales bacterium]